MNNPLVLLAMSSLAQAITHGEAEELLPSDFNALSDDIEKYLMPKFMSQASDVVDVAVKVLREAIAVEKEKSKNDATDNNLMLAMLVVGTELRDGGLKTTPEMEALVQDSKKYLVPKFIHVGDIEALTEFTVQHAIQTLKDGIEKAKQECADKFTYSGSRFINKF